MADTDKLLHCEHRSRMRAKLVRHGADVFDTHQLLELLLFHSIPRADTNPTAHLLLEHFGSVQAVLAASIAELEAVAGIGRISALMLSLAGVVARKAELDDAASAPLDSEYRRCRYIHNWYKGKPAGCVAAFALDSHFRLVEDITLSAGRMFRAQSYCDAMVSAVKRLSASYMLLSHSHADGVRNPSVEDLYLTGAIRSALAVEGVELLEHYIVTATDCTPCSKSAPGKE